MDNSEIFIIGLRCFLSQHPHLSQALQQKVLDLRLGLLQKDAKLVQFSVTPFVNYSIVDLEFVREKAVMTICLTDKGLDSIKMTGRIVSEDFQLVELGEIAEEKLQGIIEDFNRQYGSTFFDATETGMTTAEYIKTQKIKAATRAFLDDKNIAGVGISENEVVFYLAKKVAKKKLTELYPAMIENTPVVFKHTGVFLP